MSDAATMPPKSHANRRIVASRVAFWRLSSCVKNNLAATPRQSTRYGRSIQSRLAATRVLQLTLRHSVRSTQVGSGMATAIRDGFIGTIGNTPLIRLRGPSEATGCTILGKAEFLNPGGSVKDRAAYYIVKDAEEQGALRPGGVIVEGTAGNTGIGLALVGNARGYRTVIVMPETQSQEKKDMLRLCGADLRLVAAVPYANPMNYVRYSERLAAEIAAQEPNGAIWANQFDNTANRRAHY